MIFFTHCVKIFDKHIVYNKYYKIIKMLENQAGSEPGKKLCHALVPSADIHEIKENQKQTGDALSRICRKEAFLSQVFTILANPLKD